MREDYQIYDVYNNEMNFNVQLTCKILRSYFHNTLICLITLYFENINEEYQTKKWENMHFENNSIMVNIVYSYSSIRMIDKWTYVTGVVTIWR